jgi:hypothetical protein
MLTYKRNAWIRSQTFGDLEKRLLKRMATTGEAEVWLFSHFDVLISSLMSDGLLEATGRTRPDDLPEMREKQYRLTASGRDVVSTLAEFQW